jgi:hypothetical protein
MTGAGNSMVPMVMPIASYSPFAANSFPPVPAPGRSRQRLAILEALNPV